MGLVEIYRTRLAKATPSANDLRELSESWTNVLTLIVVELLHRCWDWLEEDVARTGKLGID